MNELTDEKIEGIRAKRLKECRKEAKLSLNKVSASIGANKSTICRWENGLSESMKIPYLKKLAQIYKVNPMWLWGYDVPKYVDIEVDESKKDVKEKIIALINQASPEDLDKIEMVLNVFMGKFKEGSSK